MGKSASKLSDGVENSELKRKFQSECIRLGDMGLTEKEIEEQLRKIFSGAEIETILRSKVQLFSLSKQIPLDANASASKLSVKQRMNFSKVVKKPDKSAAAAPLAKRATLTKISAVKIAPLIQSCEMVAVKVAVSNTQHLGQDKPSTSEESPPVCDLCKITFLKDFLLERHIKYSDVHATNVQKMNGLDMTLSEENNKDPGVAIEQSKSSECAQLLFSGHKMFWRSKHDIDLHIYLHVATDCIEIIPFDRERELNRLYLDHAILQRAIVKDARKKVDERKETLKSIKMKDCRNKDTLPSDEVMMEDAKKLVLSVYIIDRLQLFPEFSGSLILVFVQRIESVSRLDCIGKSSCIAEPPDGLTPVQISARQRHNAIDVNSVLGALAEDTKQLSGATSLAERFSALFIKTSNRNPPKKLWQKAFGRVRLDVLTKKRAELLEDETLDPKYIRSDILRKHAADERFEEK